VRYRNISPQVHRNDLRSEPITALLGLVYRPVTRDGHGPGEVTTPLSGCWRIEYYTNVRNQQISYYSRDDYSIDLYNFISTSHRPSLFLTWSIVSLKSRYFFYVRFPDFFLFHIVAFLTHFSP
jgi:hypothetical protein